MKCFVKVLVTLPDLKGASQAGLDKAMECSDAEQVRMNLLAAIDAFRNQVAEGNTHRKLSVGKDSGALYVNSQLTLEVDAGSVLQKVDRKALADSRRAAKGKGEVPTEEQAIANLLEELS